MLHRKVFVNMFIGFCYRQMYSTSCCLLFAVIVIIDDDDDQQQAAVAAEGRQAIV